MSNRAVAYLGIAQLPEHIRRLAAGKCYGLICADTLDAGALIAGSLHRSLSLGHSAVLVTERDPAQVLAQTKAQGFELKGFVQLRKLQLLRHPTRPAVHAGHNELNELSVLDESNESTDPDARTGAARFVDELDRVELAPGSLVVFDSASNFFQLGEPRQAAIAEQRYRAWARTRGHCLLSVFVADNGQAREFVTLKTIAAEMAGFAMLVQANGRLFLDVRHWLGANGQSTRELLNLTRDERGQIKVLTAGGTNSAVSTLPANEFRLDSVLAMSSAFEADTRRELSAWVWADSIETLLHAARTLSAATVVLTFSDPRQYEQLCTAVRDTRGLGNPRLRVVIREYGARLRMPMALVLLRLGASLIIPIGTPDSGAKLHIDALRGTRFNRVCDLDVVQVTEQIRTLLKTNSPDPGTFRRSVEQLLAHTESYDIEHSMVRLYAKPGQRDNALAIVEQLGRDFLVAHQGVELWLFLFACNRSDVRMVLERIFADSLNALFSDWSAVYEPARMLAALESIRLAPAGDSEGRTDRNYTRSEAAV